MIKIVVPNKQYNETVHGFTFVRGVAVSEDDEAGRKFAKRFGYSVEEVEQEESDVPKKPRKTAPKKAVAKKEDKKEG